MNLSRGIPSGPGRCAVGRSLIRRPGSWKEWRAWFPRVRLLLSRFLRLRPEFRAPALTATRGPRSVPSVALHADHLVQEPLLGFGETGHPPERRGGALRRLRGPSCSGLAVRAVLSTPEAFKPLSRMPTEKGIRCRRTTFTWGYRGTRPYPRRWCESYDRRSPERRANCSSSRPSTFGSASCSS